MIKRLLMVLPTLWIVATLTFFFLRWIPGGPFDQDRQLPPEIQQNLEREYGLDLPLYQQYTRYLFELSQGNLGPSLKYKGRDTADIIAETLPVSLFLGFLALCIAIPLGLVLGVLAGVKPGGTLDRSILGITSTAISLPNFVVASILVLIFSLGLQWLPPALWEGPRYWIMPAITLSLYPMAFLARLLRSSMIETLQQDFIQTARAKGVHPRGVVLKHALKNALSSSVTILGPLTASLITGSFIVEMIFAIPGMGQYFVTSVTNRDYPLVLGVTLVYAVFVIAMNLFSDLMNAWIDPRVSLD